MSNEDIASEALLEFLNAAEAGIVAAKRVIAEAKGIKETSGVREETFTCLKFENQQGARLGEYGVAHKTANLPDKFSPAYGILRKNNATIKERFRDTNFVYSYWLYGEDKIYRKKLKPS